MLLALRFFVSCSHCEVSFARTAICCFLLALRAHEKLKKRTKAGRDSKITEKGQKRVFFLSGGVFFALRFFVSLPLRGFLFLAAARQRNEKKWLPLRGNRN